MLTTGTGIFSYPEIYSLPQRRVVSLAGEMAVSESALEGPEEDGKILARITTGPKDTSMRLTIRRQTSKLKLFVLKLLTVREARCRKRRRMNSVRDPLGWLHRGELWGWGRPLTFTH